jgi:hypothetical protein
MHRLSLVPIEWLKPHEQHVESRVLQLVEQFRKAGSVDYAVVADVATGTVVDGHHRLEALRRLGARFVPCYLIDYKDGSIGVAAWRDGETPPTKDEVLARAAEGRPFPPKTTRHDIVRVLDPVDVPLASLMDERVPRWL